MSNHRRLIDVACFTALLLFAVTNKAHATLIPISIGAFSGNERIADFTVAASQTLPYSEEGATFASFSGQAASVLSFNNFLFMGGSGTLRVNFSDPEIRAGFVFGNGLGDPATITAQAFSDVLGTQSLGQVVLGSFAANQIGFVGFAADAPFLRADISFAVSNASASFRIDDFRFESGATAIPEPSTVILTLCGASWLSSRRRRQRR
jgi:hypothetical protein